MASLSAAGMKEDNKNMKEEQDRRRQGHDRAEPSAARREGRDLPVGRRDRGFVSSASSTPSHPSTEMMIQTQGRERRTLFNLCLGMLGSHLEDISDDLGSIAEILPAAAKMALLAIARRRGLLKDDILLALVDESWEILDVSEGAVTDFGIERASKRCPSLKAVDISQCDSITELSVQALVLNCPLLQTLRCGGTKLSNAAARKSLHFFLPGLNVDAEAEENWENLELKQIGRGAQALRWLVWPAIDEESHKHLLAECPKVAVNPANFTGASKSRRVPSEALPGVALDNQAVHGIDPSTWATRAYIHKEVPATWATRAYIHKEVPVGTAIGGLSIAERFKLAFTERDERLAPKRAKNFRQNQRRAEKAWLQSDTDAKAVFWAGVAQRTLKR